MHQTLKLFVLGAAALAMVGVGAISNHGVFAQESTPEAESTPAVGSAGETDTSAYDDFVAALAVELGISDPATVDAAIKETLKQQVDEQLAAGEISANRATELKARIDAGDFGPLFGFGRGDHGGRGGPRPGDVDDKSGQDDSGAGSDAAPTATAPASS
jgi:Arc/MetJ family transcription regulator